MGKEENKGQDVIFCPNCGENKVRDRGRVGNFTLILAASILFLLVITIPISIILWIYIIVSTIKNRNLVDFSCSVCKHGFSVDAKTAKKYREAIK